MDSLIVALVIFVIGQNFYILRRLARLESRLVRLQTEFANHIKYLHGVDEK